MMIFSEFGRRVKENASNGTDHGTAGNIMLIGDALKKPGMFNAMPSLEALDENGDMRFSVDFRRVYATVLHRWLGHDPTAILGAGFEELSVLA